MDRFSIIKLLINYKNFGLPNPSSSSSTKFCDTEKQCSPCRCYRCCKSSFFNDHTYSILKRICHKIIKNYSRQRCRENYSVFDGGNSTSIRSFFKGQKDGADSYYNGMQTKSVFRKNGIPEKKNEDVSMPDIKKNLKGKPNDAHYENTDKWKDSTRPIVSGENNIAAENKKLRNGNGRVGKVKKIEVIVSKKHNDTLEDETKKLRKGKTSSGLYNAEKNKNRGSNDANKEETKQFLKSKGDTDHDKDGFKKSVRPRGSDGADDLNEGLTKQAWRGKNLGENEDRDKKNKKSNNDQTKIKKKVDQGGINKYEDRLKNLGKGRGKRISELNQYITNGKENERDEHLDDNDGANNKLDKISKKSIGGKGKGNNIEGYQAMSKKKGSEILVKDQDDGENIQNQSEKGKPDKIFVEDQVDGKDIQNQNGKGKPDKIALGTVRKNSEKSKIGSGKGSRHLRYADTYVIKGTRKRGHSESSKLVANRKLYSSRKMTGLPLDLQSCRYIRPCDVLRVKLEERDLSRCITCCSYTNQSPLHQSYISCRPYQCGLSCC